MSEKTRELSALLLTCYNVTMSAGQGISLMFDVFAEQSYAAAATQPYSSGSSYKSQDVQDSA